MHTVQNAYSAESSAWSPVANAVNYTKSNTIYNAMNSTMNDAS